MKLPVRTLLLLALVTALVAVRGGFPGASLAQPATNNTGDDDIDSGFFSSSWANLDGQLETYADGWGASTGFISVPHARALRKPPAWLAAAKPESAPAARRTGLAVIGLPLDTRHAMLSQSDITRLCLAENAPADKRYSLCRNAIGADSGANFAFDFRLCDFDPDCWHSTAAAIFAAGAAIDPARFSLQALSRVPYWNMTYEIGAKRVKFDANGKAVRVPSEAEEYMQAEFSLPAFPRIYLAAPELPLVLAPLDPIVGGDNFGSVGELVERLAAYVGAPDYAANLAKDKEKADKLNKLIDEKMNDPAFDFDAASRVLSELYERIGLADATQRYIDFLRTVESYLTLPDGDYPLVELYSTNVNFAGQLIPDVVNRNVMVEHGARPGGPLVAFNVFSVVNNAGICADAGRAQAPCVLTSLNAQAMAFDYLLTRRKAAAAGDADAGADAAAQVGAIVVVAGGPKAQGPCDDNPTAKAIGALRRLGVYTFVPAGNDGEPGSVRFPACVSAAIAVGSLDRDGQPMAESNGAASGMVDLWIDGDTAVIPMRAPPLDELRGCISRSTFAKTVAGYQAALTDLGFAIDNSDGTVGPDTRAALGAFQTAQKLTASGRFDRATLAAIEAEVEARAKHSDDLADRPYVARNLQFSDFADLEDYGRILCEETAEPNQYHAYFAGGTLVSASVAAGLFAELSDRHPDKSAQAVAEALLGGSEPGFIRGEAELKAIEDRLR